MDEKTGNEILSLIERTKSIMISALDEDGVPIIKGVTKLGNDGYGALYFCTSPESRFFRWYADHPRTLRQKSASCQNTYRPFFQGE